MNGAGAPGLKTGGFPRQLSVLVVEAVDVDAGVAVSVLSADPRVLVRVAPDRLSALDLLARFRVHLILLGVEHDEADAVALLTELKELEHTCCIPIVVLALPVDGRDLDHWYHRGAAAVLRKPMRLTAHRELMRAVGDFWLDHALLPEPGVGASRAQAATVGVAASGEAQGSARRPGERVLADAARELGLTRELLFALSFEGRFEEACGPWRATVGLGVDQVRHRSVNELAHPADRPAIEQALATLRSGGRVTDLTTRLATTDGHWRWLLWSAAPVREHAFSYAAARDVTPHLAGSAQVAVRAHGSERDPMTGLFTRKRFEQELERELARSARVGPADASVPLTASIGVAPFHVSAELGADALIVEADIALCDAKQAGRDCVVVFDSDHDHTALLDGQPTWPERVRDAVDRNRFVLHAQPILPLGSGDAERHELLLRMVGDAGDLIPPSSFLGVAERAGVITDIDRWVVREAIGLIADHRRAGRELSLEVNVSARSLRDSEFSQYIAEELGSAGVDGRGLCLEVTETAAIENFDRAKAFSEELTGLGCEFALDDFGSGLASFYNVKHLPFDYLKIDGDFIHELPASPIDQVVVKSIVDIAGSLGKRTIAEFVGDAETLELLRTNGVDYAQGFHVGRPASLASAGLTHTAAPA